MSQAILRQGKMRDFNKRAIRPSKTSGIYTPYVDEREALENLANAIIIMACNDFMKAYRTYRKVRSDHARIAAWSMMDDCIRFFRSQWFGTLTDINPEDLIQRLREERKR